MATASDQIATKLTELMKIEIIRRTFTVEIFFSRQYIEVLYTVCNLSLNWQYRLDV